MSIIHIVYITYILSFSYILYILFILYICARDGIFGPGLRRSLPQPRRAREGEGSATTLRTLLGCQDCALRRKCAPP